MPDAQGKPKNRAIGKLDSKREKPLERNALLGVNDQRGRQAEGHDQQHQVDQLKSIQEKAAFFFVHLASGGTAADETRSLELHYTLGESTYRLARPPDSWPTAIALVVTF